MSAAVSVIVPTYQRAELLSEALDSVLAQTHAPAQIIVVDDGSTDATAQVLATYAGRITTVRQANAGKPAAINAGLSLVTGDYIWIFDDDDIACADALARHLAVLERQPEIGFTYSGCFRCHTSEVGSLIIDSVHPVRAFDDDEFYLELLLSCYTAGPAVVVRTRVQEAAGLYRADLLRCEDLEMALRWGLCARGARLDDPRPTYYRRTHIGARGAAHERFAASESAARARDYERLIMRKFGQGLELRDYLPYTLRETPLNDTLRTRARLRRWAVYMQKGLWAEAHDDLATLAISALNERDIVADLLAIGPRAVSDLRARQELVHASTAMAALFGLLQTPALDPLRWTLLRQLYHSTRAACAVRAWEDSIMSLRLAARLLGRAWPRRPTVA